MLRRVQLGSARRLFPPLVEAAVDVVTYRVLCFSRCMFRHRQNRVAQGLLAVSIGLVFAFTAPFLPIYTPSRARAFRGLKWGALIGALVSRSGPTLSNRLAC